MDQETLLDYVLRKLEENKGRLTKVAVAADVPLGTIRAITRGLVKNPHFETVQKLADYFRRSGA
ncbi:MAG: helix-turn-helix domain-containing protein [Alphaproteobacteria bacterium]